MAPELVHEYCHATMAEGWLPPNFDRFSSHAAGSSAGGQPQSQAGR
jgi:hypothetical protein